MSAMDHEVALNSNSNRIEGSGFILGMSCISIFESSDTGMSMAGTLPGERQFPAGNLATTTTTKMGGEEELDSCSSSIGRNSDLSEMTDDGGSGETEVQSSYKGPLDTMDALEEVLPFRRSISKFYCGKSKSFTSLADASSSSSIKDITKPENAYSRKRKNLLACSYIWDKNKNFPLRSNGGGISKRPTNSSRSSLALAIARTNSDGNNTSENSNSKSPSPPQLLPPLHPLLKPSFNDAPSSSPRRNFSPWRSFSLADLQCATVATTTGTTSSSISNRDK